ncbi:Protein kinase-like domain containing protein [Naviculisporaceae sp. PSN 640]
MANLFQLLNDGQVTRDPRSDENSLVSRFVPGDVLAEVSSDSIAASLSWPDWLRARWSNALPTHVFHHCRNVFAILILVAHESAINKLVSQDNITDDDLPLSCEKPGHAPVFSSRDPNKEFPSFKTWPQPKIIDFLDKQWMVLAPVLHMTQHSKLVAGQPLPITKSRLVKAQGTRVFIHQAWFHPKHAPFAASGSPVAIKEFKDKHVFDREKEILDRISHFKNNHLIQHLASYETSCSYCLVFPWAAGGHLGEFWHREGSTPRTPDLILWSLEQMVGLAGALQLLYEDGTRHGDIKPLNILHFTQPGCGRGTLVLADVGISKFHHQSTGLRNEKTMTDESTWDYEAPEVEKLHPSHHLPRSRSYDSWSVGCVLMEFVVWLLYGSEAVKTFQDRRKTPDRFNDFYYDRFGAFFRRDIIEVHPVVKRAFVKLREDARCGHDRALGDLLTLISNRLLQINPKQRATAPELHTELNKILQRTKDDPSYLGTEAPPEIPPFFRRSQKGRTLSEASRSSASSAASFGSGHLNSASPNSSGFSLPSIPDS